MLATLPQVSVVIPVLNEEKNIIRTLETLLSNERYPRSKIEIIFIDGGSTDRSYEIIECFTKQSEINCLVLKNEGKITPKSLNIGIRSARSKIILRADAHALYGTDYIYYSVKNLIDGLGDNIGGRLQFVNNTSKFSSRLALVSNSIFGSGGASYRNANKPAIVDTVWCGCWYKDVLEKVGLFDENWSTNQDWELNARLRSKGYTIYFEPKISARLLVRNSFSLMLRQYYRYGQGRAKSILRYPQLLKLRQIMPILFCCILVTLLFANKLMVAALLVFSFGLLYCFRGRLFHTSSISIKDIFQIMIIITGINTSWTSGLIYIFSKRFISWLIYKKNAVLKHIQDLCSKKK